MFSNEVLEDIDAKLYTQKDGLSYKKVQDIAQDQNGFLWVATSHGLNKFDGYNFISYTTSKNVRYAPLSNDINALAFDKKGILYTSAFNIGLSAHDPKTGEFHHIVTKKKFPNLPKQVHGSFRAQFAKNCIWVSGHGGIYKYDIKKDDVSIYHKTKDPYGIELMLRSKEIVIDHDGIVWTSLVVNSWGKGLAKYNPSKDRFDVINNNSIQQISFQEAVKNSVFLHNAKHVYAIKNGRPYVIKLPKIKDSPNIKSVKYWNGLFWIATHEGLYYCDPNDKSSDFKLVFLKELFEMPTEFSFDKIEVDNMNNMWVATVFGLLKLSKRKHLVSVLYESDKYNSEHPIIPSYAKIDTNFVFKVANRTYHNGKILELEELKKHPKEAIHISPHNLCNDQRKRVFVIENKEIHEYNIHTQESKLIPLVPKVKKIFYDKYRGLLWVLNKEKVFKLHAFDPNNEYKKVFELDHEIIKNGFKNILVDNTGEIWFYSQYQGAFRYKPESRTIKEIMTDIPFTDESKIILSSFQYSKNKIIFGTRDGLIIYNKEKDKYSIFHEDESMNNTTVGGLVEDKDKNIWVFSDWGILRYDISNNSLIHLFELPNLFNPNFGLKTHYDSDKNIIYFTTSKGLAAIKVETLTKREMEKKRKKNFFNFNYIKINGEKIVSAAHPEIIDAELPYTDVVHIPKDYSRVEVHFSDNSFSNHQIKYRYKLLGFDKNWIRTENEPKAIYTFLPVGDHYLHVEYSEDGHTWSKSEDFIKLSVRPPFWRSKIAITIYFVIAFIAFATAIFTLYATKKKIKEKRKIFFEKDNDQKLFRIKERLYKDLFKKREDILKLVMEEQSSAELKEKVKKVEHEIDNLLEGKFANSEELFSLDFRKVNFLGVIQEVYDDFKEQAALSKVNFNFNYNNIPELAMADEELILEIYKGILSVTFRYLDEGDKLNLTLETKPNSTKDIVLTLNDTSKGFPEPLKDLLNNPITNAKVESSVSIQIMHGMIKAHRGRLKVQGNEFGGNKTTLTFPSIRVK